MTSRRVLFFLRLLTNFLKTKKKKYFYHKSVKTKFKYNVLRKCNIRCTHCANCIIRERNRYDVFAFLRSSCDFNVRILEVKRNLSRTHLRSRSTSFPLHIYQNNSYQTLKHTNKKHVFHPYFFLLMCIFNSPS